VSAQRSANGYGVVLAAVVAMFLVSQCADGSVPSASQPADVTVVDERSQPVATRTSDSDQAPQSSASQPRSPSTTSTMSTVSTVSTVSIASTTLVITTTTALVDPAAAGPADAGVAAPVRGEQIQLTEPLPAPATTTTTTEAPPPPATHPPVHSQPPAPQPPQTTPTQPPPPATEPPAPPPASTSSDAIALTNQARASAGLASLNANGALNSAAAAHSADQAARNQMTHTGSDGSDAGDRIRAAGYQPSTWGENVAAGYTSASSVVAGWMGSSGHRANILNPAFTEIGVASATAADGTRYWTMVLAG
jgi:uncharacterized protein YkwD